MPNKDIKKTEIKTHQAEELLDEALNQVVGAGPIAFPDVGSTSSSTKVSVKGGDIGSSSSSGGSSGSVKNIISGTNSNSSSSVTGSSTTVHCEGGTVQITGDTSFQN